jgi:RluA family pseudouridine synthase
MPVIDNISSYKFTPLSDLKTLRLDLLGFCRGRGLKGTILLSTEGINLFIAGPAEDVAAFVAKVRTIPGLEDLQPKHSPSDHQPFRRMLVRLKKEIIAFGVDGIVPAKQTSLKLPARELKKWLDEGRPVTLLDTRNDYEVRLGTFRNALPIGIDHFRKFPDAVRRLPAEMKEAPIVMFCTGGIRCEKAGPFMEREGFQKIFQLDGGILKYFEECGNAHYDGECFVFDERVGVDGGLHQTESTRCYACQSPLTKEEQADSRYVVGKSCPYCFEAPQEKMRSAIAARMEKIRDAFTPLPGSVPHDNFKPVNVPLACDGHTLLAALCFVVKSMSEEQWLARFAAERVLDLERVLVTPARVVRAGERFLHRIEQVIEPAVNADVEILHEDEAIIVLNKPAPLPVHPGGRFFLNTLQNILNTAYAHQRPNPAHRLDANTTGVMLVTRTRHFASLLQPQFTHGEIEKTYVARVQGHPSEDSFVCEAPISEEAIELGARTVDFESGLSARTEFFVRARLADGTAIVEAKPITGRTNQIRVHLWHLGHPVCGDAAYLQGGVIGRQQTLDVSDPPLCLHAWRICFNHPITKERMQFEAPQPAWAQPA